MACKRKTDALVSAEDSWSPTHIGPSALCSAVGLYGGNLIVLSKDVRGAEVYCRYSRHHGGVSNEWLGPMTGDEEKELAMNIIQCLGNLI